MGKSGFFYLDQQQKRRGELIILNFPGFVLLFDPFRGMPDRFTSRTIYFVCMFSKIKLVVGGILMQMYAYINYFIIICKLRYVIRAEYVNWNGIARSER